MGSRQFFGGYGRFTRRLAGIGLLMLLAGCAGGGSANPDANAAMRQGDQLRAQGNDAGAAGYYAHAVALDADDIAARQALADILEAHGDYAGAAEQYRGALRVKPDDGALLRGYGRVLLKKGDAAGAKDAYEKAVQLDSDDAKALDGRGVALDTLGNHIAAQGSYRAALDSEPGAPAVVNNLGRSFLLSGAYADAVATLEPYAAKPGAPAALRQNLAEAYAMQGMDADAERILRLDNDKATATVRMAALRAKRDKVAPRPRFYADLGHFATRAMADAKLEAARAALPEAAAGLVFTVAPGVDSIGGVPHFAATVTGFAHADRLRGFCARLKGVAIPCQPHGL